MKCHGGYTAPGLSPRLQGPVVLPGARLCCCSVVTQVPSPLQVPAKQPPVQYLLSSSCRGVWLSAGSKTTQFPASSTIESREAQANGHALELGNFRGTVRTVKKGTLKRKSWVGGGFLDK